VLISLAARNLLRNPRRTVLTGLAIALGLAMMVFTIALQAGSYDEMIESAVSTTSGHVVVQRRAYVEEPAADVVVPGSDAVAAALRGAIPDAVVAQRLTVDGLLTSSENAVAALVRGVEPSAEARVDLLSRRLVEGEWLQDGDARGVILGRELADSLGVELGDRVVYQGQHGGETTSVLLRVRGVFRVGAADIDGFIAVVDLAAAREMLGQPDVANQVTAHLPDDSRTAAAAAAARAAQARLDG
jgi:ABC-type lipoprotein release transport system permease subunit